MKLGLIVPFALFSAILAVAGCSSSSSSPSGSGNGGGDGSGDGDSGGGGDSGASSGGRDGGSSSNDAGKTTPTTYSHVVLDFDDLTGGANIEAQYAAHATFSSSTGCASQATDNYDFGQSPPNYVTTYFSCASGDTAPVNITFAKPVKNITLSGIGVNDSDKVATFTIKHSDGTSESADWIGAGDPMTPQPVDLTKFTDVAELDIASITDAYGVGYDDLAFDFPDK